MDGLYIGLMSGTSLDGIDCALVKFSKGQCELIRQCTTPLQTETKRTLLALCSQQHISFEKLCQIDSELGQQFADAVTHIIAPDEKIVAVGSHGQTLAHYPKGANGNSLQIGNANRITAQTGITTVTDFRRADIANGGQGAPLASAFHAAFMAGEGYRFILNIGGMANITVLNGSELVAAFDIGPGNVLVDTWIKRVRGYDYDACGDWARTGHVNDALLARLMALPYITEEPPKSTGRELFNEQLIEQMLAGLNLAPADVQATLTEFTAACVSNALYNCPPGDIVVCGGGAHNTLLMERIRNRTHRLTYSSAKVDIHPDYVEAMAFAWFAHATLTQTCLPLSKTTGARKNVVAGAIYPGSNLRLNFHES